MLRPTPIEVASGVVGGRVRRIRTGPPGTSGRSLDPLGALKDAVRPALGRPPCVVSFSGGLDSSFILAVATAVARTSGLPPPIPCTWRISGAPSADESVWQERVIASLQLSEWVKLQADDDLDLVGPVARRLLRRHGLLHPTNVHLHLPIVEMAAGGSVLTGAGGDQVLSGWRTAPLADRSRSFRDTLPSRVRAAARQHRRGNQFPWLHSGPSRRMLAAQLREIGAEPKRFDRRVTWHRTRRDLAMSCSSLALIASDHDVQLVNPFVDDRFVAALAETRGLRTVASRSQLLEAIAAGAVPAVTYAPRAKARFLEVFLRSPTRDFVASWDGSGVAGHLVNAESLQALWSKWPIPPGTAGLVQQTWLVADRSEASRTPGKPGACRSEVHGDFETV